MDRKLNKLVLAALFAALTCIATMIIQIPTIGTSGFVNIGDTMVLLSAWALGGIYGAAAAGVGSALADVISGFGAYAPGTFAIKALMAFAAFMVFSLGGKSKVKKNISLVSGGVIAEAIMILGYFLYESTLLGYGLAAAASVISNAIQGITSLVIALVIIKALDAGKVLTRVGLKRTELK